ncbi:MAG: J domain-containing protein [Akkermansiaceae bacterium]|nr:J domain-containing protein [Akkermansiaceae bacterium]MCF7730716.1 J domain-containing protein [Akkermansiaceae bacterium]
MAAQFKDYYATLGVSRDASHDVIRKAFRNLARKYHPDVAQNKSTAEEKFKEINEAYEVLGDPEKRGKYDRLGAHWNEEQGAGHGAAAGPGGGPGQEFHFGGTGFSDFFEQYFSGGTRFGFPPDERGGFAHAGPQQASARARRGGDVEGDILVTLDEVMHGTLRSISMQIVNRQQGETATQTFQVRIPPGATDGRRIRVPGHGEPGHGGAPAGDLFLRVRHAAHPDFSSERADLYHDLDIAPWEAVLGAEVAVPSLDGTIKLRIPAGAENGQQLRVRGRGLPKDSTGERGDFFVVLNVLLPTAPGSAERALWEQLRDTSTFRPRPNR